MNEQEHDRQLVTHVARALNADLEELDPATRARLEAARGLALERAEVPPASSGRERPLAWTLAAFASAAGVVLALALLRDDTDGLPVAGLADLELLSAADGLDLYEDLDFYEWLETEPLG